jgi:predicted aspartyl protease
VGQQLLQQGVVPPAPITGTAIIDTGAMMTCIDDSVAKSMGLPIIDVLSMISASHSAVPQNVYPIRVEAVGTSIEFDVNRAMGSIIDMQGVILLLGRDALRNCTLFYNGTTGQFSLSQ